MKLDKTTRGGLVLLAAGIILIVVIWKVFLAGPVTVEPLASIPLTAVPAGSTLFEIQPLASEPRFLVGEILRGQPKTVIGYGRQVAGQIALDFDQPDQAVLGPIQIDARTFVTDNEFRNFALHSQILRSEQFPRFTFTPTAVTGLPASVAIGTEVNFSIQGNLTIRDVTQEVTFLVTVVPQSTTRLEGTASASVNRDEFNLVIPEARDVAAVDQEVRIEMDWVATAVNAAAP